MTKYPLQSHLFLVVSLAFSLLCVACLASSSSETVLHVGISLGLDPEKPNPSADAVQLNSYEGLLIWKEAFNSWSASNRTTTDGRVITFEVENFENYGRFNRSDPTHETALLNILEQMANDSSIDFILPPVGSPWGSNLRNRTSSVIPFTIGLADSRENWYRHPGSYGAPTSSLYVMSSALPYLRLNGAKTAYVIQMRDTFQTELCKGFVDQSPYNDIKVIKSVGYDTVFALPTQPAARAAWDAKWDAITDDLIQTDADVMVMCDYGAVSEYVISILRKKNYAPEAIVLSFKQAEFQDTSLVDYVIVPTGFHPDARYPPQNNFVDASGYDQLVRQRFGKPATSYHAHATLAGFLLSNAVLLAEDNSTTAVENALKTAQFASFMGISRYDPQRRQLMDNMLIQRMNGSDTVVGPALAAKSAVIYPMPTWEERVFKPKWGHPTEIVGLILMIIGAIVSIGWLIFVFVNWTHPVIIAASPIFCVVILIGSLLVYGGNIVWMPGLANLVPCILRAWIMPLGVTLIFGALVVKTHRIYRIFYTRGLSIISIPNSQVGLIVGALVLVQVVFSILMTFVGKINSKIKVEDPWRVSKNYRECTSSAVAMRIIYGINLAYAAAILGYGSFLAVKVRRVPYKIYDESKIIHWATYNTVVFSIIAAIIQIAIGSSQRFIAYIIITVCMFLGPMITICLLFIGKMRSIRSGDDSSTTRSRSRGHGSSDNTISAAGPVRHDYSYNTTNTSTVKTGGSTDMTNMSSNRVAALTAENEKLKKENRRLRAKVRELNKKIGENNNKDESSSEDSS